MVSSTFRPAIILLCSASHCLRPISISIPPEARGPVFTVRSPRRIGSLEPWARMMPGAAKLRPAAAVPCKNERRSKLIYNSLRSRSTR